MPEDVATIIRTVDGIMTIAVMLYFFREIRTDVRRVLEWHQRLIDKLTNGDGKHDAS